MLPTGGENVVKNTGKAVFLMIPFNTVFDF